MIEHILVSIYCLLKAVFGITEVSGGFTFGKTKPLIISVDSATFDLTTLDPITSMTITVIDGTASIVLSDGTAVTAPAGFSIGFGVNRSDSSLDIAAVGEVNTVTAIAGQTIITYTKSVA